MSDKSEQENSLVFSYLTLRKTIGILGIALPVVLAVGGLLIFEPPMLQKSISAYYHTDMRQVFVGTLWALGFFLLSYKGYERADAIAGDLGCIFAVGMTFFPTWPDPSPLECLVSPHALLLGRIHVALAGSFFLTLIYFSLFLFTKTDPSKPPTRKKLQRNMVYRACGYVMALCVLLIGIYYLVQRKDLSFLVTYNPVFWLEAVAIVAFGISWLTKGEAILKDE